MSWQKILLVSSVCIGCILFYFLTKMFSKKIVKKTKNMSLSFGVQVLRAVVFVIAAIFICMQFEVTKEFYQTVLTNISLIVVVLGFAAQESIRNLLSGIMIIQAKPFNIGQKITLVEKNITGTIKDITLRHTVIQKINNATVIIPNSIMNNAIVENTMYKGTDCIANFLDIQVAYESDIEKALELIKDVVGSHPKYLKEKPISVLVRNLGTEGYDVRTTVWTQTLSDNFTACSDMRIQIKKVFDDNGIEIPYNHMIITNL